MSAAVAKPRDPMQENLELVHEQVSTAVRANPYAAVAAGLGVGVVLGGGIPNWALRLAVGGAARVAVAFAMKSLAEEAVEEVAQDGAHG